MLERLQAEGVSAPRRRGFTLVELIVVISITTVGFLAMLDLQVNTIRGTGSSRDQQEAMMLAEHTIQSMRQEAYRWTAAQPLANISNELIFLNNAPTDTSNTDPTAWFIAWDNPASASKLVPLVGGSDTRDAGIRGLYRLGADSGAEVQQKRFCVHYRLAWMVPNQLLRAEVRVMWPRYGRLINQFENCQTNPTANDYFGADPQNVQTITIPISIIRNIFVRQV